MQRTTRARFSSGVLLRDTLFRDTLLRDLD
jgi:hypothetical protein